MTDEPYEDELYEEIGMILNRHKLVSATRDDIKEFIESHYYFGLTPPLEPFKLKGLEPLSKKLKSRHLDHKYEQKRNKTKRLYIT